MRRFSGIIPILIIVLIVVIFFGKAIFFDKVIVPADLLFKELPWKLYSNGDIQIQNHTLRDIIVGSYPIETFISKQLKSGTFPIWAPELGCGTPIYATGSEDTINLRGLLLWLIDDVSLAHNLLPILYIFLAGIFSYIYLVSIGISKPAALVGAIAFMLNFHFMSQLLHGNVVGASLWLPLIFLFLDRFNLKRHYINVGLAGLFIGFAILNGTIQSMLFIILAVFIFFSYHAYYSFKKERSLKSLYINFAPFSLIILIGLSVASVKIIPTLEMMLAWNERGNIFSFSSWVATLWKKPLAMPFLIGFVFPDLVGNHRAFELSTILGNMGGWETPGIPKVYIGIMPFIFALFAIVYRKCEKTKLFLWIGLIPIVLILFTPLYSLFYFRGFVLWAFAGSVLAGLGADWLLKSSNIKPAIEKMNNRLKKIVFIGFALLALGNIFLYIFKDKLLVIGHDFVKSRISRIFYAYDTEWQLSRIDNLIAHYNIFNYKMYLPFIISIICILLLWAFGKGILRNKLFIIILVPIVFFDLAHLGWDFLPMVDRNLIFPETESTKFLKRDKDLYRVATVYNRIEEPPVFSPNTLLPYDISNTKFYGSLYPKQGFMTEEFYDLLNAKYVLTQPGYQMETSKYKLVFDKDIWIYENKNVLPRAYFVAQSKFVETENEALLEMRKDGFIPKDTVIIVGHDKQQNQKELVIEPSMVKIVDYKAQKVEINVDAMNNGFLVLSDRYYPGWKVYIDGKESHLYNANYIFRAVELNKGKHSVVFVFNPLSFRIGLYMSIISSIAIIVLTLTVIVRAVISRRKLYSPI